MGIGSYIGSLFGGDSTESFGDALSSSAEGIDWGSYIGPSIKTGLSLYSNIAQAKDQKAQLAQNQSLDQAKLDWDKEKFYAQLAQAGGGGGGGGDPFAAEKMALARRQANDQAFGMKMGILENRAKANSEAIRTFVSGFQSAYK
jgi:hypothetical protein